MKDDESPLANGERNEKLMYTVIVENDESEWADQTGELYHFPKRYLKYLQPGTKVVYYKGRMTNKQFAGTRLTKEPHYFGIATMGESYLDPKSKKGDLYAEIVDFQRFVQPVLAKLEDKSYLEDIPDSKLKNYWRDGVRPVSPEVYARITGNVTFELPTRQASCNSPKSYDSDYESYVDGQKQQKFVTTYERDKRLRAIALSFHGATCKACDFNFGQFYGDYAEGFIHVHHVVPVSEYGGAKQVNPETDLIPLCANCHSVVHRRKDRTLSIAELKAMISQNRQN